MILQTLLQPYNNNNKIKKKKVDKKQDKVLCHGRTNSAPLKFTTRVGPLIYVKTKGTILEVPDEG